MGGTIGKLPSVSMSVSVRKGYVPVLVGKEAAAEPERFLVHVKQLSNPGMVMLLELAADELGYRREGTLRILCDADYFREMVDVKIKQER